MACPRRGGREGGGCGGASATLRVARVAVAFRRRVRAAWGEWSCGGGGGAGGQVAVPRRRLGSSNRAPRRRTPVGRRARDVTILFRGYSDTHADARIREHLTRSTGAPCRDAHPSDHPVAHPLRHMPPPRAPPSAPEACTHHDPRRLPRAQLVDLVLQRHVRVPRPHIPPIPRLQSGLLLWAAQRLPPVTPVVCRPVGTVGGAPG